MKKLLAIFITVILLVSLAACGQSEPELTADEALDIALERAGVTKDSISNLESVLDTENGVLVYEIDFDAGNTEYSYDVNAETGAIVERDVDRAD